VVLVVVVLQLYNLQLTRYNNSDDHASFQIVLDSAPSCRLQNHSTLRRFAETVLDLQASRKSLSWRYAFLSDKATAKFWTRHTVSSFLSSNSAHRHWHHHQRWKRGNRFPRDKNHVRWGFFFDPGRSWLKRGGSEDQKFGSLHFYLNFFVNSIVIVNSYGSRWTSKWRCGRVTTL
jgi:hypothetical protein